jgi:hypothetical protein
MRHTFGYDNRKRGVFVLLNVQIEGLASIQNTYYCRFQVT